VAPDSYRVVSGYRFSDTVRSSRSETPSGDAHFADILFDDCKTKTMTRDATIESMNLTINGEPQASSAETLAALVEGLGMKQDRVAIELNREIVPRDQWPQTPLHDGDRLEIVHFVGGGCPSLATHFATC
jgi:sulfur carrier protein